MKSRPRKPVHSNKKKNPKWKIIFWIRAMQCWHFELRQNQPPLEIKGLIYEIVLLHFQILKINLPAYKSKMIYLTWKYTYVGSNFQLKEFPFVSECNYYLRSFSLRNHFPSLLGYFSWIFNFASQDWGWKIKKIISKQRINPASFIRDFSTNFSTLMDLIGSMQSDSKVFTLLSWKPIYRFWIKLKPKYWWKPYLSKKSTFFF